MNIIVNNEDVNFDNKTIYVDGETAPRNGKAGTPGSLYGPSRLVQIYCPDVDDKSVYIFDTKDYPLPLIRKKLKNAAHIVGHNFIYDMNTIGFIPTSWDDTFILDTILNFRDENNHGLDDVAIKVFKRDMYGDMFKGKMDVTIELPTGKFDVDFSGADYDKKKMQRSDWGGVISRTQYAYAALDVWILPTILESFDIEEAGWTYKLDKATVTSFVSMAQRLPIDVEGIEAHRLMNLQKIEEINIPINVNSYQQVRPYISGLPKAEALEKGRVESGDDALAKMCAEGNEKACQVRTVRSLLKQNSFLTKFLNERTHDDYIKGYLNIGTRSGRSKCASMNLQQIPQAFKKYIKVKPGKFMVYSDFAQLELRSLCVLIGEPVLENLFRTGEDIHNYTRDALFDKDTAVSDAGRGNSLRQIAKIYNFASLYGAGWATIGNVLTKYTGMILTEAELKANKVKWLKGFPGIKAWHDQNIRHWQAKRVLSTPMGRKYVGNLPTDTNNIQNQGLGAEVAKLAMVYMSKEMDLSKFLIFVHDSWTAEYDTMEEAKEAVVIMSDCMHRAWRDITANCKITDLDMPINSFIGRDWKTIDDTDSDDCLAEYELKNGIGEWK